MDLHSELTPVETLVYSVHKHIYIPTPIAKTHKQRHILIIL
jgi:hypothetical protein